jgi:hypothetical protein
MTDYDRYDFVLSWVMAIIAVGPLLLVDVSASPAGFWKG